MSDPNPFDEAWLEWLCGCYRKTLGEMSAEQKDQLECAFYAGAAAGLRVSGEDGLAVVVAAIGAHLKRKAEPA